MLPFTRAEFLAVFAEYNTAIWPTQIAAYLLGIAIVCAILWLGRRATRTVMAGLSVMWIWTGAGYHLLFFAPVNPAAYLFGAFFLAQGGLFLRAAMRREPVEFRFGADLRGVLGAALIVYAMALYPLAGALAGHAYPEVPVFGVTPCPVTIFTFGVLLLSRPPVSRLLLAIPVLWSLVGGSAAFLLGIPQDWPLLLSGIAVAVLSCRRGASQKDMVQ